jgi:dienelactone hydrolase
MQWYEYGLVALVIVGAAGALILHPRSWMRCIYVTAVAIVLWRHFNVEGPHWQVFPLYLAIGLLVVIQFAMLNDHQRGPVIRFGAWLALACCLVSLGLSWILPMFDLPKPTGPYAVGVYTGLMRDATRGADALSAPNRDNMRELAIQFWYPAKPKTGYGFGRYAKLTELRPRYSYKSQIRTNALWQATPDLSQEFPVILFGPMWGGSRVQNTALAEDLASHGYIVVAVDHPFNAAIVDTSNGIIQSDRQSALNVGPGSSAAGVQAVWAKELAIWTADDEFVLRQLTRMNEPGALNSFPWGTPHMDLTRIGALGHSFGGASSIALLGTDPRVKSAVNMDGWTFNAIDHRTTQPVLFLYEGATQYRQPGPGTDGDLDRADNAGIIASLARYGGTRAYVAGTLHTDFTDAPLVTPIHRLNATGPIGPRAIVITRALVLAFFDATLKNPPAEPTYPNFPEVKFDLHPAPSQP